jgi:hypothetical protein
MSCLDSYEGPQTSPNFAYCNGRTARRLDSKSGRFYEIPGLDGQMINVPSVTTVLNEISKPFLREWALKLMAEHLTQALPTDRVITPAELAATVAAGKVRHKEVMEQSGLWGTRVHESIQARLISGRYPKGVKDDPPLLLCLRAFEDWWSSQRLTPVVVEEPIWSLKHEYGGTLDALAKDVEGRLFILDWKSSKSLHESNAVQISTYARAWEEMTGVKVDELRIVRIGREGAIEVLTVTPEECELMFQVFLALRAIWDWRRTYKCKPERICQ